MDRDSRIEIEPSLWDAAERVAIATGSTVAHFVNQAVAQRLAEADSDAYWSSRAARARPGALSDLLLRAGTVPPGEGDRIEDEPGRPA